MGNIGIAAGGKGFAMSIITVLVIAFLAAVGLSKLINDVK